MKIGAELWYAKRINQDNATIQRYYEPEKLVTRNNYLTVMPASTRGLAEVMKYGETLNNTWTAIANANFFDGKFDVGDVFYLDGHTPNIELENRYGYGCTANAVVKNVSYGQRVIHLTLVVNQKQVKK